MRILMVLCLVIAVACSWNVTTKGEILDSSSSPEVLEEELIGAPEILEGAVLVDTTVYKVLSDAILDDVWIILVEMEVGELEMGVGDDPDTLIVDHRP